MYLKGIRLVTQIKLLDNVWNEWKELETKIMRSWKTLVKIVKEIWLSYNKLLS